MGLLSPSKQIEESVARDQDISVNPPQPSGSVEVQIAKLHEKLVLPVLGMTCASCQHHVEAALRASPGIGSARVDLMRHRATIEFDPKQTNPAAIVGVIQGAGYDSVLPRAVEKEETGHSGAAPQMAGMDEAVSRAKAIVTIVAGILVMVLSMPLMMGSASRGLSTNAGDRLLMRLLPWLYQIPRVPLGWALLIVSGGLAVWAGRSIYAGALKAGLRGESSMNTLVSLGTGVAFAYSSCVVVRSSFRADHFSGDVYFDSVLLILGFLLLGKWLEARARMRALASLDALARLQPVEARIRRAKAETVKEFEEVMIPAEQVQVGDLAVILPGERVAVDAMIETGRTTVDESMLTGESVPVERGVGERVLAGSLNYDGAITARVESVGAGTTLSQIARLVESAQSSRAPMERLADRASAVFVPAVLGLAAATFLGWLFSTHDIARAVVATVAVLVIACPCAMGLAVPAALTVAIGRGAQFGVLIKGGEALERLATLNVILLDKTGTLTAGKPSLTGVWAATGFDENELLQIAAAVEDRSSHPLAHAVVAGARAKGLQWTAAEDVQVIPGRGLSAEVGGRRSLLGNAELMQEWGVALPKRVLAPGETRLWVAITGEEGKESAYEVAGCLDARDTVRASAPAAVRWLKQQGMGVEMLTGDSAAAAAPIAEAVGISEVRAALMPADKVSRIRELQEKSTLNPEHRSKNRVGMVGDGINDAAALAQADAGMAMGTGAALAQEAGDVLLLTSDPVGVVTAIALSRRTISIMRQNLIWAVGYNVVEIPLAAGLFYPAFHLALTPWMAAAAMAFSSVSVLANSLRLRGWRAPLKA